MEKHMRIAPGVTARAHRACRTPSQRSQRGVLSAATRIRAQRQLSCSAAAETAAGDIVKPTRGVLILPGLGNNSADYDDLSRRLQSRGLGVQIAPVSRPDWGRNAAALTDGNWWKGKLTPRPAVDWYLNKVDTAMQALKEQVDGAPITVLTHSAGGWLGRVYLLSYGNEGVDRFVSLGSPHLAPPVGVVDQTRGILTWVGDSCPGAHHPSIKYVTIAGRFVQGVKLSEPGSALAKFAGVGYQQVCGQTDVWGDFIVPVACAHLEGATNVDIDGVFHSPLGEKLSFFGPWYGSEATLQRWAHYLSDDVAHLQPGDFSEPAVAPLRS